MDWKEFKKELPKEGKLILFGNHRMVEIILFHPEHERYVKGKIAYKDITHWCYINPPPVVYYISAWGNNETK